ncbi:uncharacterized protein LOC128169552 [Crassostrea angulata]|uniref:uncharacterized protein LOC128169552 n=1 Tax=Magallana angulata TaxID=2784310 RepID=UPI0022B1AFDE|nr:uncharacterized protein LOC128169552 [Crassostrea angulata]
MSSFVPVGVSFPRLFTRQVLELWDYQFNAVEQRYERVCFRVLHMFEPDENPQGSLLGEEFFPPRPVLVQDLPPSEQERLGPSPTSVPPPRPPPPNFGAVAPRTPVPAIPVSGPAIMQVPQVAAIPVSGPASPDPVEPYSPTDTPTKRYTPSPPLYSPDRLRCDQSYYVARQDHQFRLPECPVPRTSPVPFSATNPPLQPAPEPRRGRVITTRRRAPSPPRAIGRGRGGPYPVGRGRSGVHIPSTIPSERSAFLRPFQRARNLFADFIPNIDSPPSPPPMVRTFPGPPGVTQSLPPPPRTPSPPLPDLPASREPSPDIMLELYEHTRHPVDPRTHLTILPSWSKKAIKEEMGECVICYGDDRHLQVQCQNCRTMKVCCTCVVGVYQSINSCPVCRFRGEF